MRQTKKVYSYNRGIDTEAIMRTMAMRGFRGEVEAFPRMAGYTTLPETIAARDETALQEAVEWELKAVEIG